MAAQSRLIAAISGSDGHSVFDCLISPLMFASEGDGPRFEVSRLAPLRELLAVVTPLGSVIGIWGASGTGLTFEFGPGRAFAGKRAVRVARRMIGRKVGVRR